MGKVREHDREHLEQREPDSFDNDLAFHFYFDRQSGGKN